MGQHTFLKLGNIKGDVDFTLEGDGDLIEIDSFSFNVANKIDDPALIKTGEHEGDKMDGISISKKMDKSSPKLLDAVLKGIDLKQSKVYFCRPEEVFGTSSGLKVYAKFTMENTYIEDYSFNGGSGYPTETLTLQFSDFDWVMSDREGKNAGGGSYSRSDDQAETN